MSQVEEVLQVHKLLFGSDNTANDLSLQLKQEIDDAIALQVIKLLTNYENHNNPFLVTVKVFANDFQFLRLKDSTVCNAGKGVRILKISNTVLQS
jgi:hypothetical protein